MMRLSTWEQDKRSYLLRFSPSKLDKLLSERKLTPYGLAQRIGKSTTWVQKLLDGQIRMPREPYLLALAEGLGVHYSELLEDPDAEGDGMAEERAGYDAGSAEAREVHLLVDRIDSRGGLGKDMLQALLTIVRANERDVERAYEEQLRVQRLERKRAREAPSQD